MKIRYLRLKHWLLATLGGLLGLSMTGCGVECEYGCPEGVYHVKGTVTDEKGTPLEGIGVFQGLGTVVYGNDTILGDVYADTTDSDGRYEVRLWCMPDQVAPVDFHDIDGDRNGLYSDTVVTVSAPASAFQGGDGEWNQGIAEITKDVVMHPVKEDNK